MATANGRRRRRRSRSRAYRRTGYVCYSLAVLLVALVASTALARDDNRSAGAEPSGADRPRSQPVAVATTRPVPAEVPTEVPTDVGIGADVASDVSARLDAPASIELARRGPSSLEGISITDNTAATGDTFGVLLYVTGGALVLGVTDGLELAVPDGTNWLPFTGEADAVNAALASLQLSPDPAAPAEYLAIVAVRYSASGVRTAIGRRTVTLTTLDG